jgi:hypothetical protein
MLSTLQKNKVRFICCNSAFADFHFLSSRLGLLRVGASLTSDMNWTLTSNCRQPPPTKKIPPKNYAENYVYKPNKLRILRTK